MPASYLNHAPQTTQPTANLTMPADEGIALSSLASSGSVQPRIVEPFTDLCGRDPRAVGMLRVDEDIEFLRNDYGGDDKERGCARADPVRAELDARPPSWFGVPAHRQAGRVRHLRIGPDLVRDPHLNQ